MERGALFPEFTAPRQPSSASQNLRVGVLPSLLPGAANEPPPPATSRHSGKGQSHRGESLRHPFPPSSRKGRVGWGFVCEPCCPQWAQGLDACVANLGLGRVSCPSGVTPLSE